jgi:LmbE family N-acetylglucosaminyl deacetylase
MPPARKFIPFSRGSSREKGSRSSAGAEGPALSGGARPGRTRYDPRMTERRILAVYGHPDDEGQVTGTLARFIEAGDQVTLVCATRGEVGEISAPDLSTPGTLWYTRELELRAAMAQIGLADVRFLPYRDSGMDGTPENEDVTCLFRAEPEKVVGDLVRIIRDVRPTAIYTWDPTGGYGHPDHITVHKRVLEAFDVAGNAEAFPDCGEPWRTQYLYWGARAMKRFAGIWLEMEKRGLLAEPLDPERRERFEKAMEAQDPPTSVIIDVSGFTDRKRAAAGMHRSQFGENSMFARIPDEMRQQFYGEERFYQARPEWVEGTEPTTEFPF